MIVTYEGNQYYLSEEYIQDGGLTDATAWTSVPAGATLIDVVGGVINNFNDFVSNNPVTIVNPDGTTTVYNTVEEYLETIIEANESKTMIVTYEGNQYYLSEDYIQDRRSFATRRSTDLPAGATLIDVVGGVINNFNDFVSNNPVTIVNPDGTTTVYNTVEEYLETIIEANESKTMIVTYEGNQYYLSEEYIQHNGLTDATAWTSVPAGATLIDVVGGVINNFNDFVSNNPVTIVNPDGTTTVYNTVEEYLETIIEANESKTMIVTYEGNQYYLSEEYIQDGGLTDATAWTSVPAGATLIDVVGGVINNFNDFVSNNPVTIVNPDGTTTVYNTVEEYLETIIEANESKTMIVTYEGNQYYLSEEYIQDGGLTDATAWTSVPAGATLIDVVDRKINNFNDFVSNNPVTIVNPDGTTTVYNTVEEYLETIIEANESKTMIVTYEGNQYYLSEEYIQDGGLTDATAWTSVPAGATLIDVVGGVINNFNDFVSNNPVTIVNPDGTTTVYNTVEEYLETI